MSQDISTPDRDQLDRRGFLLRAGGAVALASLGGLPLLGCEPAPAIPGQLSVVDRGVFENGRLRYFRFHTDQVNWDVGVNVLVPADYDTSGKRYPVMYLHHGGAQDFRKFHAEDDIVGVTANRQIITVMPDAGTGWEVDAVRSNSGARKWESFHIKQLIPWVDANFRTYAAANGRAVSGFSMGGYGALKYMARFPNLFDAITAHSGPPDMSGLVLQWAEISSAAADSGGGTLFGGNQTLITANNPCAQIPAFKNKSILLVCGVDTDINESNVRAGQQKFRKLLTAAGIAHEAHELPGAHFVRREMLHRDYDLAIAKLRKAA